MSIRTRRTSKRIVAAIAAAGIAATTFATASPAQATQSVVESRVGGLDRYATASLVGQATFPAPTANIILASGQNFPDGLAAAGLAGAANAPVLLTDPNSLPSVTANAMAAIFGSSATKTVHIVGGEAAVSAAVATQVTSLGYTVNRVAGDNRYETAADIAAFQSTLAPVGITSVAGVALRTAIVATGGNFPDALSGGAAAFAGKHPVLLTASDALPEPTSTALSSLSIQRVILLGGESAVSAAVAAEIATIGSGIRVDRIGGANRGETAKLLADVLVSTNAAGGFNFYGTASSAACLGGASVAGPNIGLLVSGTGFADALAAGPHAGACKAPILIAGSASAATFLAANATKVGVVRAIGGPAAVSEAALDAAVVAATLSTPTTMLSVNEGSAVIKADFSEPITVAGDVKVNNGTDLCVATATALPAGGAALTPDTCYLITANNVTTLWVARSAGALVEGDSVVVSGFTTPATAGSRVAATATSVVPGTPAALTGTIGGATVSGTAPTVTFNRPVDLTAGVTQVTIVRASAPTVTVDIGPLTFATALDTQLATKATISVGAPLVAGDIITVKQTAATGVAAGTNLLADISAVVQPAGATPALTSATGVLTSVGGVLNTNVGDIFTNVVIQAKSALPDGAISVVFNETNAGTNSVATTATAALDNVSGITTVTVKLGTDATGAIDATSSEVAAAINAGTSSAVVVATSSEPTSTDVVPALAATPVPAGTRSLAVTGTASKTLTAVTIGNIAYDGNNDGFADNVVSTTLTSFTAPSNTFVVTVNLGVGPAGSPNATFTAGTSQLRLAPAALTDTTALNSAAQIIAITAP